MLPTLTTGPIIFRRGSLATWLLVLAGLVGGPGWARPAQAQSTGSAPFHLTHARRRVSLPYSYQRNLIIISARLNGQGPFNFVLDTGVACSLLLDSSLQAQLHLQLGERCKIRGAGSGESLVAYQVDGVRVTAPGLEAPRLTFLLLSQDVLHFSGYVGMPIHGILGADVFRSFVVTIAPAAAQLEFHDPARYKVPTGRRWVSLPLTLEADKPYLTVPVTVLGQEPPQALRLLLDTGAGHALSLDVGSRAGLAVPAVSIRRSLGMGLSGLITGFLGRTARLQLGRYALTALSTSFPDARQLRPLASEGPRNGSLGYEVLSRFTTVIDYPHQQLLLKPNPRFGQPFNLNASGLELLATGPDFRRYQVTLVQAGSPAAAAGLRVDDELLYINLLPAAALSMQQIQAMLSTASRYQLQLVVRRADGELASATLHLQPL